MLNKPEKLIERRLPLFLFMIGVNALAKAVSIVNGGKFPKYFIEYKKDTGIVYFYEKDLKETTDYFFGLIMENDEKIYKWLQIYEDRERGSRELISKFLNAVNLDYYEIQNILAFFGEYFYYSTIIPFFVLLSIDKNSVNSLENVDTKIQKIIDNYSKLRLKDRSLDPLILKINKAAAALMGDSEGLSRLLTIDELRSVFEGKKLNNNYLRKREFSKLTFNHCTIPSFKIIKDDSAVVAQNIAQEIVGKIACTGKVKGRVCIVNAVDQIQKFQPGNILVSINLSPKISMCLSDAAGIVTNEGGVVCHATIFAREYNIPAVVGTKIATKILSDGDLIEVDAENGKVIILEKDHS